MKNNYLNYLIFVDFSRLSFGGRSCTLPSCIIKAARWQQNFMKNHEFSCKNDDFSLKKHDFPWTNLGFSWNFVATGPVANKISNKSLFFTEKWGFSIEKLWFLWNVVGPRPGGNKISWKIMIFPWKIMMFPWKVIIFRWRVIIFREITWFFMKFLLAQPGGSEVLRTYGHLFDFSLRSMISFSFPARQPVRLWPGQKDKK